MKKSFTKISSAFIAFILCLGNLSAQEANCLDYRFYYSNVNGSTSSIYGVTLGDGVANMDLLKEVPYSAHIAYNSGDHLLYIVNSNTGAFQTLDVAAPDGVISTPVGLDINISNVINATFNHDNKMLIAAESTDKVYQVTDLSAGTTLEFSDAPIMGGDISFDNEGNLLLATRKDGGKLFRINSFNPVTLEYPVNIQIGTVPALVTGIAKTEDGNMLLSAKNANAFVTYAADGSGPIAGQSYSTPFTLDNGDMASGCAQSEPLVEGCQNFKYYYIADNTPGYSQGTVFSGDIVNGEFALTELFASGISAHLAVNNVSGDLYVINGNVLRTYNESGDELNSVSTSGLGGIVAAVWNPADGLVYAGSGNQNKIYKIDPISGASELVASQVPVAGGDLILDEEGNLLLIHRNDISSSKLYAIDGGTATLINNNLTTAINGAAMTQMGGFIAAKGNNSNSFYLYDLEGNNGLAIDAVIDGEPFLIVDGDMASGCIQSEPIIEGCLNFEYYYIADNTPGFAQGTVFKGEILEGEFALTELFEAGISAHLAVNESNGDIYIVNESVLRTYNESGDQLNSVSTSGLGSIVAAVWNSVDGLVYAGTNQKKIYKIDPASGASELVASQVPVQGGDLIIDGEGNLMIVERDNNTASKLHLVVGGVAILINDDLTTSINGAAITQAGGIIAAKGNNSNSFYLYDIEGNNGVALAAVLNGEPFPVVDGDMASGCFGSAPVIIPGQCYATEVIGYTQGTTKNGGQIQLSRTDASEALGQPERVDQEVFVTLGYNGSITLAFDGAVQNLDGFDIEVVETSFGNPSCEAYPEFAKVYVSQDGVEFFFARTICRTDGLVDISDAGDFDYITQVRIVNENDLSESPDGFDVDGVVALHNCDNAQPGFQEEIEATAAIDGIDSKDNTTHVVSKLSSYPNPTSGPAIIQFVPAESGNTNLVVLDMNGRIVQTLYNAEAVSGEMYNVDFDGLSLPNGIYITRLTTNTESIINKIIIGK